MRCLKTKKSHSDRTPVARQRRQSGSFVRRGHKLSSYAQPARYDSRSWSSVLVKRRARKSQDQAGRSGLTDGVSCKVHGRLGREKARPHIGPGSESHDLAWTTVPPRGGDSRLGGNAQPRSRYPPAPSGAVRGTPNAETCGAQPPISSTRGSNSSSRSRRCYLTRKSSFPLVGCLCNAAWNNVPRVVTPYICERRTIMYYCAYLPDPRHPISWKL